VTERRHSVLGFVIIEGSDPDSTVPSLNGVDLALTVEAFTEMRCFLELARQWSLEVCLHEVFLGTLARSLVQKQDVGVQVPHGPPNSLQSAASLHNLGKESS
jgi:hypothetical protein